MQRYIHDIAIALEAILANKVKSMLTALGIIFGVAAVISMLAIGNGARQEILEQMKMVGVNNIIVQPVIETEENKADDEPDAKNKFSPGLTIRDYEIIKNALPNIQRISPQITKETFVVQSGLRRSARLYGVNPSFFELFNIKLIRGEMFTSYQLQHGLPVCIISEDMAMRFFSSLDIVNRKIKCSGQWFSIVGVAEKRNVSENSGKLGLSTGRDVVYIPVETMLLRVENRALVTAQMLQLANNNDDDEQNSSGDKSKKLQQLDKLIIQVKETKELAATSDFLKRMLLRRHQNVEDFEIIVPELLLKQQQKTKDIFNVVLGAIAGISLLVGGIGIMNIMLASVLERIKEIGTRMALGATRKDIVVQFIAESTIISVSGGLAGIVLGVVLSSLVTRMAGILTIVSISSVVIAFGISSAVGIIFGYMPAKKASQQDPVVSLRSE